MARELQEETGLKATGLSLLGCFGGHQFRHVYPHGDMVEYVVLLFHCETSANESAPSDSETVELRYFAREEVPGLELPYPLDLLYPQSA